MGKFPGIKIASGALCSILDSDEDGEQDDLSLDDNCESIDISDESFEGDEDLECQYERQIMQHLDTENAGSVALSSVTESTDRRSSSSLLSILKAPKSSDLARKKILVVQPSSAAVERAFSIMLNNAFKDQQHNSLQDYIEVSTMLRYNNRKN